MRSLPLRQPNLARTAAGRLSIAALVAAGMLLALALCGGCRNKTAWRAEYYQTGELAALHYSDDSGWSFWSDGDSKIVDILDINLSGVGLK